MRIFIFALLFSTQVTAASDRDYESFDVRGAGVQITSIIYSSSAGLALVGVKMFNSARPMATMAECEAPRGEISNMISAADLFNCRVYRSTWFEATDENYAKVGESFQRNLLREYQSDHRGDPAGAIIIMMLAGGVSSGMIVAGTNVASKALQNRAVNSFGFTFSRLAGSGGLGVIGIAGLTMTIYGAIDYATRPSPTVEATIMDNYRRAIANGAREEPVVIDEKRYNWAHFFKMVQRSFFDSLYSLNRA